MNIIQKLPGPFLIFLGAFCLSFGGLIVKSFEGATLWQILFWRQFFFVILVSIFLLLTYKKKIFIALYESGLPGFFGGIILGCGFSAYVFAMYKTTVANTNFIIQTQAIFLAIFGYLFLREKISKLTLVSIILAITGIILMVGNSLSPGQLSGNLVAFIMPISFAILIIIVRKYPKVDMIPLQLFAGIVAMFIGYFVSTKINISTNDILLAFIAGFFQVGLGFIFITIGAKKTLSATVGILMMTEAVFGPFWAWMFLKETPQLITLIGGSIIIIAVLIIIVRKYPKVDMVPLQLVAGIVAMMIGYFVSSKISVSTNDLILGFLAGFFQVGLGFIFITIGAKKTLSAMVGILMMTEAVLGPFWAWIFLDENPQFYTLVGGLIILFAVFAQFYSLLIKEKKAK